jgi:hypothetical protein
VKSYPARAAFCIVCVAAFLVAPRLAVAGNDDMIDPPADLEPTGDVEPVAPPFGTPGEIAISGTSGLGASYRSYAASEASSLSLGFGPAVDVFVARNVSLGLSAGVSYSDARGYGADGSLVETTTTTIDGAVRAGIDVPIADSLSFWPRVFVGFEWVQQSQQAVNGGTTSVVSSPLGFPTTTRDGPWASIVFPLTLHVAPHVFASFGPSLFHEFSKAQGGPDIGGERTTVGAFLEIGGWFGGRQSRDLGDLPQLVPVHRFGSVYDVVISNDIALQGSLTSYAGSNSTGKGFALTPGVDVFVVEHLSVGITASATYSSSTGIDSTTGNRVSFSHPAYGIAPRIGADIPLGAHASLWPSFSVGFGEGSYTEGEARSSNDQSESYVWISLYVPVLVHPVSHLFIGFGPSVSQDLSHSITYPDSPVSQQNRATAVGAGLTIGGVI